MYLNLYYFLENSNLRIKRFIGKKGEEDSSWWRWFGW